VGFVENLSLLLAVKEFWKSVKNWQSYCHEFGVLLTFGHSVYAYYQSQHQLPVTI